MYPPWIVVLQAAEAATYSFFFLGYFINARRGTVLVPFSHTYLWDIVLSLQGNKDSGLSEARYKSLKNSADRCNVGSIAQTQALSPRGEARPWAKHRAQAGDIDLGARLWVYRGGFRSLGFCDRLSEDTTNTIGPVTFYLRLALHLYSGLVGDSDVVCRNHRLHSFPYSLIDHCGRRANCKRWSSTQPSILTQ